MSSWWHECVPYELQDYELKQGRHERLQRVLHSETRARQTDDNVQAKGLP